MALDNDVILNVSNVIFEVLKISKRHSSFLIFVT